MTIFAKKFHCRYSTEFFIYPWCSSIKVRLKSEDEPKYITQESQVKVTAELCPGKENLNSNVFIAKDWINSAWYASVALR